MAKYKVVDREFNTIAEARKEAKELSFLGKIDIITLASGEIKETYHLGNIVSDSAEDAKFVIDAYNRINGNVSILANSDGKHVFDTMEEAQRTLETFEEKFHGEVFDFQIREAKEE